MKVTVEFLSLPNLVKMAGGKSVVVEFSGHTVEALLRALVERYGSKLKNFILDEAGKLDMSLRVTVNKENWVARDQMDGHKLSEGDLVTIMMLVGGG